MQYYSIGKLFRMHSFVDHIVSHIINIMNRTVTTLRGNQDVEYIEHNIEAKISVCTEQNGAPWVSHAPFKHAYIRICIMRCKSIFSLYEHMLLQALMRAYGYYTITLDIYQCCYRVLAA